MEKISIKFMRIFYVIMLVMLVLETINTLILGDCLWEEMILGVLSAINFVLFSYTLMCNLKQMYYQSKIGCKILQWTMGILLSGFTLNQAYSCDCSWFMIVQNVFVLIVVEGILWHRIKNIEYLENLISKEGRQWII